MSRKHIDHSKSFVLHSNLCLGNDTRLKFDSTLEAGNLEMVREQEAGTYDITIRNDSNSQSNLQWFYFRVRTPQGLRLPNPNVKFNIINLTKKDSLFEIVSTFYI